MTNETIKAELKAQRTKAKKELDRLNEERRDARDRDDQEEVKAISKMTWELNMRICSLNKAIREIAC